MNVSELKKEFPIFEQYPDLVYLDSAATTQKPRAVIEAISEYYLRYNANAGRGVYRLSEESTRILEEGRKTVADFIGAKPHEIIFCKNGTEAANAASYGLGDNLLEEDENIVISGLEHHSNYLPWLGLCIHRGAESRMVPVSKEGQLDDFKNYVDSKTKLVAITQMSNVLGNYPDLPSVIELAHQNGAVVMLDAVQGISHFGLDVSLLKCDLAMISAHKIFGPLGIGVLYVNESLHDKFEPFITGGGTVNLIKEDRIEWAEIPNRMEAGTQDTAAIYGLIRAIEFFKQIDLQEARKHENTLNQMLRTELGKIPGIHLLGNDNGPIVSIDVPGVHSHDLASVLAEDNVCIRAGTHCAQPLVKHFLGLGSTARFSFHIYNDEQDVERAIASVKKAIKIFN